MKEIEQLYHNEFGISFYWKKEKKVLSDKIQLVFKEIGFYLTIAQLREFCQLTQVSKIENACCDDCQLKNRCHKFLLKTPTEEIDLAVNMEELFQIEDLIKGTLFTIQIEDFVYGLGRN